MSFVRVWLLLPAIVGALLAHNEASAASADNGKTAFRQHGCWQCHGYEGQGSVETSGGRVIADTKLPLDAFKGYVRAPSGAMPPFRAQILSDDDLADIYAYLQSQPKPKSVSDLPLLNNVRTQ